MAPLISPQHQAVIRLETYFPRFKQDHWRGVCLLLAVLTTGFLFANQQYGLWVENEIPIGILCIVLTLYIDLLAIRLFSNATYYAGLNSITGSGNYERHGFTYDAMTVLYHGQDDLTGAFLESSFGQHIYIRAELSKPLVMQWLTSNRLCIKSTVISPVSNRSTTLIDIVQAIMTHDSGFVTFMKSHGVTNDTLLGAAHLVMGHYYQIKRQERWWSRDVLGRRGSLGRELTLGAWRDYVPYTKPVTTNVTAPNEFEQHYLNFLHSILQSRRDSNILLIAPDTDINRMLIEKLQHSFIVGTALGSINTMSIMTIDHDALLFENGTTIDVESALRRVLTEASDAGNMIIVLDELEGVAARYATKGVLFTHIIEEFLTANRIHVIITSTSTTYPNLKRTELPLVKRCEEVVVEALTEETLLRYLTTYIYSIEATMKTVFSYHALTAITKTVYAYDVPLGARVQEIASTIAREYANQPIITHDMAERSLGNLLDLPIGPLTENERDILLSIERIMQQEVVGQSRAINAIGIALRRTRASLIDTTQPQASFLFLGPSGVGKTETAKTLAKVYFGNETAMLRFDMSEFADHEALSRLIGSETHPSFFESQLQMHPRGIILFDEFEKAHTDVQAICLQLLDEGQITTYSGAVLRFRPYIIIATSNAGSDLIARTRDKRTDSPTLDSDIIAHIIRTRALTPELIGRFTDVILFDALTTQEEVTIAHQLITALGLRVRERGFALSVEPTVPDLIVEQYHNSQFGARTIRHAIEHVLEDIIATHIIRGDVKPGDTIFITKEDLPRSTRGDGSLVLY
ncbi:MAG: hypothetical protein RLZZ360_687 [Candidatus Parcubacteria bacterium]|jgi:ATP-dependent Clp protease ATP-binding subunit ClpC